MPLRLAQAYILDTPVVESLVPQYPEFSASGGWGDTFQDSKSESWLHAAASVCRSEVTIRARGWAREMLSFNGPLTFSTPVLGWFECFFCHCKIPNVLDIFDYCRIIFASLALESDDEEMRGGAESDFGPRGRPSVRPQNVLNSFSAFTYFCRNFKEKSLQTFFGQKSSFNKTNITTQRTP